MLSLPSYPGILPSSLLVIASLTLITNASSTILYTYRNNYLRVSDSLLFKGWIVTKQKKPSLSRFLFQVRMVYPSLLWSNLSSMHSVMNTGNHLDSWLNQPFSFYRSRVILTVWWISKHCSSCWRWSRFTILLKKQRKHLHRQTRVKQGPMRMVSVWRSIWCFYRNWQKCYNLSGQSAVVEETKDNAARVNVSCNGQALKESFYLTSILW